jgi:septin family protein
MENNFVVEECIRLQRFIQQYSEKFSGPVSKSSIAAPTTPFVLLLGNHSSGKSSFINYIIQKKIQTTGVAPTDDGFTVIGNGSSDLDRDGPAFVGDVNLGFQGLQQFGPMLLQRTQLKIRANLALSNVMLVDTPGFYLLYLYNKFSHSHFIGMIDSPVQKDITGYRNSTKTDRGYDFEGILHFFS